MASAIDLCPPPSLFVQEARQCSFDYSKKLRRVVYWDRWLALLLVIFRFFLWDDCIVGDLGGVLVRVLFVPLLLLVNEGDDETSSGQQSDESLVVF